MIEYKGEILSFEQLEQITGALWIPKLEFESPELFEKLAKEGRRLHQKGEMAVDQIWLGRYFRKEIENPSFPDVAIRWIDSVFGWGVFALRDFKKMEWIGEYTGKVRKRRRADAKNGYCFEYILAQEHKTPYLIDALDQGGVSRYINHSAHPNLCSSLATLNSISHVILYTKEAIAKGSQLCYDYGPDYWTKRAAPHEIPFSPLPPLPSRNSQ